MQIIVHKNLKNIKDKYIDLFNNNPYSNVFQSYEFLQSLLKTIKYNKIIRFILRKPKIRFLEVQKDNKTILILPVEIKNNKLNSIPTYDYYDLVCGNFNDDIIFEALTLILKTFGSNLKFYNVTNKSKLYQLARDRGGGTLSEHDCGEIEFTNYDYEQYYKQLSKNSRQNLRTAYNRLEKDNLTFKMEFLFGKVPKKVFKQAKNMYIKRFFEKNPNKKNILKYFKLKLFEPISKICANANSAFHAILSIDNKPAAIMSGFVNKNSIIIPRLIFDSKFHKYSPGIILINETLKYFEKTKKFNVLDLGYGNENYKFVMGANQYKSYDIELINK